MRIALIGDNAVTQVIPHYHDADINIEFCEKEQADYWLVTDTSSIRNAMKANKTIIYLSSAQVFTPSNETAFQENDDSYADTDIAKHYLAEEKWIKEHFDDYVILRTTRIISPNSSIWRGAEAQSFDDLDDSLLIAPVFAEETARIVFAILKQIDCRTEADLFGTYHYCGAELFTEYTLAHKLAKLIHEGEQPTTVIQRAFQPQALTTLRLNCKHILYTFGIRQQPSRRLLQRMIKLHQETLCAG